MQNIFISYSSKDKDFTKKIYDYLYENGYSVWWDKKITGGNIPWPSQIGNAIENCKAFILVLSSSSENSEHVYKEVQIAMESNKIIIPVSEKDFIIPKKFRYHLAGKQTVFFNQPSFYKDLNASLSHSNIHPVETIRSFEIQLNEDGALLNVHSKPNEEISDERLSVPARNTIDLIERYLIHSCPNDSRHQYKWIKYFEPRGTKGEIKKRYQIKKIITIENLHMLIKSDENLEQQENAQKLMVNALTNLIINGGFKFEVQRLVVVSFCRIVHVVSYTQAFFLVCD